MEKSLIHSNELHFISKKRIHQPKSRKKTITFQPIEQIPLNNMAFIDYTYSAWVGQSTVWMLRKVPCGLLTTKQEEALRFQPTSSNCLRHQKHARTISSRLSCMPLS